MLHQWVRTDNAQLLPSGTQTEREQVLFQETRRYTRRESERDRERRTLMPHLSRQRDGQKWETLGDIIKCGEGENKTSVGLKEMEGKRKNTKSNTSTTHEVNWSDRGLIFSAQLIQPPNPCQRLCFNQWIYCATLTLIAAQRHRSSCQYLFRLAILLIAFQ